MVKVIVHIAKAIVAVVISILFVSCGFDIRSVNGDGSIVKKDIAVTGNFNSIAVDRDLEVLLLQGNTPSVSVETDQNLQQHIKVEVKGNELVITADANLDTDTKRITVVMPNIESLTASSSATISSNGILKGESISLSGSSGSNIHVTVETNKLESEASSGAHIEIQGKTKDLDTNTSSGSNINAKSLKAENAKADASSGSNIIVNATNSLSAEASSGAKINYVTTPAKLKQNASSGGNVSQLQ
ncbi:MAG: DUF2807 domain-containing protein [Flavobacterium psychrophilum]|nr:MAG: DUF2807 domain-containing protein [Flavobacterium psychrophilum]